MLGPSLSRGNLFFLLMSIRDVRVSDRSMNRAIPPVMYNGTDLVWSGLRHRFRKILGPTQRLRRKRSEISRSVRLNLLTTDTLKPGRLFDDDSVLIRVFLKVSPLRTLTGSPSVVWSYVRTSVHSLSPFFPTTFNRSWWHVPGAPQEPDSVVTPLGHGGSLPGRNHLDGISQWPNLVGHPVPTGDILRCTLSLVRWIQGPVNVRDVDLQTVHARLPVALGGERDSTKWRDTSKLFVKETKGTRKEGLFESSSTHPPWSQRHLESRCTVRSKDGAGGLRYLIGVGVYSGVGYNNRKKQT